MFLHTFKLFLKFHKNENYAALFKQIREIFNGQGKLLFYYSFDDLKEHDLDNFNTEFCSEFKKDLKNFEIGDEIDFPYALKTRYEYFKYV